MKNTVCKCNNCGSVFIDTNPQTGAKEFEVSFDGLLTLEDHECPHCNTDEALTDDVAALDIFKTECINAIDECENGGNIISSVDRLRFNILDAWKNLTSNIKL